MTTTIPAPHAPRYPGDTGNLVAIAALTALIAGFIAFLISRIVTPSSATLTLILFITPLIVSLLATALAAFAIRFIRFAAYARVLRAYINRELARVGVVDSSHLVELRSVGADSHRGDVAHRLELSPRVLLLGSEGTGKSVTLLELALRQCSIGHGVGAAFGWARIPVLVWAPGLAIAMSSGQDPDTYLSAWFIRSGANGLAARLSRMVRRGKLILICDDYDMLDADGRERVVSALRAWQRASGDRVRIIVACDLDIYERDLDGLGALAEFSIERIEPLEPSLIGHGFIKASVSENGRQKPEQIVSEALVRPIGAALPVAAVARALGDTLAAGQASAWGLSELLRQQLLLKRDRAQAQGVSGEGAPDVAAIWGALAASLIAAHSAYIPLDPSLLMGESAAAWLAAHPPLPSVSFALQSEVAFSANILEPALKAGIEMGVLRRQVDGSGLTFIHPLMRKTAAAYWLETMDNGLGRLNSDLLGNDWIVPVMLWAGARNDAVDVAQRLYRLTQSPESIARRTGFLRSADVAPSALALALVTAVAGSAPWLLAQAQNPIRDNRRWYATQQELRDLLDAMAIMASNPAQRLTLMKALQQVNMRVGPTLEASVDALIALAPLDRLARAHLILLLGLLATPGALQQVVIITGEQDMTLRQAARQALLYAGSDAIPTLQALAGNPVPNLRERANEALKLVMSATPEASELAGQAAISSLHSADPRQRHVAVTTLSAIHAEDALDAFIARLGDTNLDVRVAAARALGQLRSADASAALRKNAHAEPPAFRRVVAEALGIVPGAQSVATLLTLLRDRDANVRAAAANALAAQGDPRAVGPLREVANDADPWARQAAQAAVRRLTGA